MISLKPYYDVGSGRPARFSKNYTSKKAFELVINFEGKVKLFDDYYSGWYLLPLEQNLREGTALITTTALLSFCDVLEQFRRGISSTSQSTGEFVKASLRSVYQDNMPQNATQETIDSIIENIYQVLRNGLHHDLAPRGIHVYVSGGVAMMFNQDASQNVVELWFNPLNFLKAVEKDFQKYIKTLFDKSDQTALANFEKMFDQVFKL